MPNEEKRGRGRPSKESNESSKKVLENLTYNASSPVGVDEQVSPSSTEHTMTIVRFTGDPNITSLITKLISSSSIEETHENQAIIDRIKRDLVKNQSEIQKREIANRCIAFILGKILHQYYKLRKIDNEISQALLLYITTDIDAYFVHNTGVNIYPCVKRNVKRKMAQFVENVAHTVSYHNDMARSFQDGYL